jgi:(p)ppGpp synthase/HD superfamily hydrolase
MNPSQPSRGTVSALERRLDDWLRDHVSALSRPCVVSALRLAREAHAGQARKHGEPYIVHPLRVAILLAEEWGVQDPHLLAAALLHDALEDAPDRISPEQIAAMCGHEVLQLVRLLTSPTEADVPDKAERNRRKAEQVLAGPLAAWRLKLADRIDNLRDALLLDNEAGHQFRARYYQETVEYYLPMAERLGDPHVLALLSRSLSDIR